ncbi:MAG TPA: hypothetical protein VNZ58_07230 [Thermomicrobiales bacterium]|nr:hypothetical protein [Thermomicrobiales bacterium]
MTVRLIPDRISISMVDARAKLPAAVWQAISVSERGDEVLAAVRLEDTNGRIEAYVMSPRKYGLLVDRIRALEDELHGLKGDAA